MRSQRLLERLLMLNFEIYEADLDIKLSQLQASLKAEERLVNIEARKCKKVFITENRFKAQL